MFSSSVLTLSLCRPVELSIPEFDWCMFIGEALLAKLTAKRRTRLTEEVGQTWSNTSPIFLNLSKLIKESKKFFSSIFVISGGDKF
jgi:hypothetical protein